ncbi:MAG TPA: sulfotransferase, partial [Acidimicrobiia bacterium]|nr:sulfotransferase [Acidimicrobiia bacterium]
GRLSIHQRTVRLLSSRLLLEDLWRRHPEIEDIDLPAPIIVVGLPRSGTTHLVNLIAADSRLRSLPFWESTEPFPLPGEPDDARIERAQQAYELQISMAPLLPAMHHQHPDAVEEEIELEDLDFASYTLEWLARVPRWRDYYFTLDQHHHYAYLRRVLQALTFRRGPRRWVLKSPQHLEQLGPLVATFPDATFAVTHRDPVSVIASAMTMLAYGDRMRRYAIEPDELSSYWVERVERLLRACVRDHELLPADRTIDVLFHEFMADDVAMVDQIYDRARLPMTATARRELDAFMGANPRGKHGRLEYDLRGHFGLDPGAVRDRFAFYFERFAVHPE